MRRADPASARSRPPPKSGSAMRRVSDGGRAPRAAPTAHPNVRVVRRAVLEGRLGAPAGRCGRSAVPGGQGDVITTAGPAAGAVPGRTAVYLGKSAGISPGIPGRGPGFRRTKNPLPGGSGLRRRVSGAPQLRHFPCAAAHFVIVAWVICQEATDCCRTKARWQSCRIAGADWLCIEPFM